MRIMGLEPTQEKFLQESESCASAIPPYPHGFLVYNILKKMSMEIKVKKLYFKVICTTLPLLRITSKYFEMYNIYKFIVIF